MSVESERTSDEDAASVETLAEELGQALSSLPVHREFEAAKAAVEADGGLQAQISEFEQLRQEFLLARQTGEATQADVEKLQSAQRELHDQPTMAAYLEAKQQLQLRLEGINATISDPLAVDFGGEAGGCCHD